MDPTPIILMLLVIGVIAITGIVGVAWVAGHRGRSWMIALPFLLILVSAFDRLNGGLRIAAAWAIPPTVALIVFLPARKGSRHANGVGTGTAGFFSFCALLAAVAVALAMNSGMDSATPLTATSSFNLTLSPANPVEVRAITISAPELPSTTKLGWLEVSAENASVRLQRDPEDDQTCRACDAHYLVAFILADPDAQHEEQINVEMRSWSQIRNRDRGSVSADQVLFLVEDVESTHHLFPISATYTTTLTEESPREVLRVTAAVPAEAMLSDTLDQWPAFWIVGDTLRFEGEEPRTGTRFGVRLDHCNAGETCERSTVGILELPGYLQSATVELRFDGVVAYLAAPFPDADTSIDITFDTPRSWFTESLSGQGPTSTDAESVQVTQKVTLDGLAGSETPIVLVEITEQDYTREERPHICNQNECTVSFIAHGDWTAVMKLGFFSDEVPEFTPVFAEPVTTDVIDADDYS